MEGKPMLNEHPAVGSAVWFRDENGVHHDALITTVHGTELGVNAINLVYVSGDKSATDQYGRQTVHKTSVPVQGTHAAPGGFYYIVPAVPVLTEG
jgi:hypothetical protein